MNIIIPANNEAGHISACLTALFASHFNGVIKVIVVANGCIDDTAIIARNFTETANTKGWTLTVLEIEPGHKPSALNAGDAQAGPGSRAYLDADVIISPTLMQHISNILEGESPIYSSGIVEIPQPRSFISRAYARIYAQVPFMVTGVPGCGLFAVNAAGRACWGAFPDIISDDTFVRLCFAPSQRISAAVTYLWPVVEGTRALLRVRRRQDAGVRELYTRNPEMFDNDDTRPSRIAVLLRLSLHDPIGVVIYAGINLLARLTSQRNTGWSRGR